MAVVKRPTSTNAQGRPRLWVVALAAVLVATGYQPRHPIKQDVGRIPGAGGTREEAAPTAVRPHSVKELVLRIYRNIGDHRTIALAAGITFYSLLAIFPAIAALVSIYGLFADPLTIGTHLDKVTGILPGGAISVIGDQLALVSAHGNNALGVTFLVGLGISLWSANAGIKSLFDALNIVYAEHEKRNLILLNAVSLVFTTGAILFVLLAIGGVVALPKVLESIGLSEASDMLLNIGRWPVLLIMVGLALALIYRFGPSRQKVRWRWITWGSAVASIVWLIASALFAFYAANFGKFNQTYGSLGAVIGFMTWIWLSAIVILAGAEIDAEMEGLTPEQRGAPQPLPMRAAGQARRS